MILFASVASGLYIGLHEFNKASSESLSIEQTIIEEKIKITGATFYGDSQITGIHIENVGSKTVNLAATYIDNQLFNEISIYLSPKESCTIPLSPTQPYLPDSIISVTTKNGAKAMLLEADLYPILPPSYDDSNKVFGPLQLEYRDFKYRTDLNTNWNDALDGWKVPKNTPVDWRIRVENVDVKERTIDLLKYSCLSLVTYGGGQRPWYIDITSITDLSGVQHSSRIAYGEEVYVGFKFDTSTSSKIQQTPNFGVYNMYIVFSGYYQNSQGNIIQSYGQTIPFEAVLVQ